MTDYKYYEGSRHDISSRAFWPMLAALGAVFFSFVISAADRLSLVSRFEGADKLAVLLSDSAQVVGASIVTALLVLILATRRRLSIRYRVKEAIAIVGTVILFAAGGAFGNEHFIKNYFKSPRPNVEWLASLPSSEDIGFTAESYYTVEDLDMRSAMMQKALRVAGDEVPSVVGDHWVTEPGYSFPSGHAFGSFFIATFFLFFATSFVATRRHWLFYLLIPWAVCVSYSRVLLQVHRPVDISVGAILGFLLGVIAWFLVRIIIRKIVQSEIST